MIDWLCCIRVGEIGDEGRAGAVVNVLWGLGYVVFAPCGLMGGGKAGLSVL